MGATPVHGCAYVGINAHYDPERHVATWAVATDTGYVHVAQAEGTNALGGLLSAFEHVLTAPVFAGTPVHLYCGHKGFLDQVGALVAAWPHLSVQPWTPTASRGTLVRAAYKAACALVEESLAEDAAVPEIACTDLPRPDPSLAPLLCATDGSANRGRPDQVAGFAWVTEHGQFHQDTIKGGVLVAELAAVEALLGHYSPTRTMRVLIDSREALAVLARLREASDPFRVRFIGSGPHPALMASLHKHVQAHRETVRFEWVRGHSGNALNDAADRLAVQARRRVEMKLSKEVAAQTSAQIIADLRAALADADLSDSDSA